MIKLCTRIVIVSGVAALAAACSTASADYADEPIAAMTTGSIPLAKPRPGECARLAQEIGEGLQRASALPAVAKAQRAAPPSTLMSALAWLSAEPGQGVPAMTEFAIQTKRIRALEAASRDRGCPPVAIDTPLADIETAMLAP